MVKTTKKDDYILQSDKNCTLNEEWKEGSSEARSSSSNIRLSFLFQIFVSFNNSSNINRENYIIVLE